MKGGAGELQVAIAGQGAIDDLRELSGPLGEGLSRVLGPREGATTWRSTSPFVAPRFLKSRGKNTLENQVSQELVRRRLPPAIVEILPWNEETRRLRHAIRVRRHPAPPPPVDAGFAIQITFDAPSVGPLTLGYGSHYGLGVFVAS